MSARPLFLFVILCAAGADRAHSQEAIEPVATIPVDAAQTSAEPPAKDATALELIIVTGSHIRRADYETHAPMMVISRDEIARSGHTNTGELLQDLPIAGPAMNRAFNISGTGQTEVDLRNLGSQRVLVLVDGQRWARGSDPFNTTASDLNSIPVGVIDHIEVLKDGASAIYGSDAIAGVINIITRSNWTGTEVGTQWRVFTDGENLEQMHHLTYGRLTGTTSLLLDVSYLDQAAMLAGTRSRSREAKLNTGPTRGSWFTPHSHLLFVGEPQVAEALNAQDPASCPEVLIESVTPFGAAFPLCNIVLRSGQTIDDSDTLESAAVKYRPFDYVLDLHNDTPLNYLLTPMERTSAFVKAGVRLFDTWLLNGVILASDVRTARVLSELPLYFGDLFSPALHGEVYVDRTNVYNPFDQDIGRHSGQGNPGDPQALQGSGLVMRDLTELGPGFLQRRNRFELVRPSLDGEFDVLDHPVYLQVGAIYSRNIRKQRYAGDLDMERVKLALGPAVDCMIADCVPLNLFGAPGTSGAITPAMLDYLRIEPSDRLESGTHGVFSSVTTDLDEAARWLAGPVGIAAGIDYRVDRFSEESDPYIRTGRSSLVGPREPTSGDYSVQEAFGEIRLPLLAGLPGVESLEAMLAARYNDYSIFKPRTTGKAGLRYKPMSELLLRGTWSQAYRAPSITELYLGRGGSISSARDPCFGVVKDANEIQHCSEEVPPTGLGAAFNIPLFPVFTGGNPDVTPELAESITAGLVFSPPAAGDFNLYLDYFRFDIDNHVDFATPDFIFETCYSRPAAAPRPATCDLVHRNPQNGFIEEIEVKPYNLFRLTTSGVDVGFDYTLPWTDTLSAASLPGRMVIQFDSQYLIRLDKYIPSADGTSARRIGLAGESSGDYVSPRFNARASLGWLSEPWGVSWRSRYIGRVMEKCNDGFLPSLRDLNLCSDPDRNVLDGVDSSRNKLPAVFYHDLQIAYAIESLGTEVTLGVWNVLNQPPPLSYSAAANTTASTFYRPPDSRAPFLRLRVSF